MISRRRALVLWTAFSVLLLGLPLWGAAFAGKPVFPYLDFPPIAGSVGTASFSWPVFIVLGVLELALACLILIYVGRTGSFAGKAHTKPFPWWGWLALGWVAAGWVLVWTPQDWSTLFLAQKFTFIWLGYILLTNAWTLRRGGLCLLISRPGYLALLFIGSAVVWWYFEYLNQFVLNWHYPGMENRPRMTYFLQATLPFSTVLPAVVSTAELLRTFLPFSRERAGLIGLILKRPNPRGIAGFTLAIASLGLFGIGLWPKQLFPLIWISPFLIFVSVQTLLGEKTCLAPLTQGRWGRLILFALASLVCGLFWEMWNFYSYPKWTYSIPYAHGFQLFEMPLLGYAGYLPFGIECLMFADFLHRLCPNSREDDPH
ncbi:MAG: hypothetical protein ABFS02_06445 [Pseudomonadota bacterium]